MITIYGAGLAGLIAANMLRRHKPVVLESQASLPHNHDALLRFRSDAVSRATGIPFKKVLVHKAICDGGAIRNHCDIRMANEYSMKVMGSAINRSIWNLDPAERWIAPPNLIALLAEGLDIRYGKGLTAVYGDDQEPKISTIPMPALMRIAGWNNIPHFQYRTITNITCDIESPTVDVYQTLYFPTPTIRWHRASITGNHLMIEIMGEYDFEKEDYSDRAIPCALQAFGLPGDAQISGFECKVQRFGKIAPISEDVRKQFILAMSDLYHIYSLGRYGTWRQLLLDDIVKDVQVIERFITERDGYAKKLEGLRG